MVFTTAEGTGMATTLLAERQRNQSSILSKGKKCSLLLCVQTNSGTHRDPYLRAAGDCFLGSKTDNSSSRSQSENVPLIRHVSINKAQAKL